MVHGLPDFSYGVVIHEIDAGVSIVVSQIQGDVTVVQKSGTTFQIAGSVTVTSGTVEISGGTITVSQVQGDVTVIQKTGTTFNISGDVNVTNSVINVNIGSISAGVVFDVNITGSVTLNVNVTNSVLNTNINVFPYEKVYENLVENPGFETGSLSPWVKGGAGTATVQSSVVYKGSYACQVTPDANKNCWITQRFDVPCHPGQVVEVSAAMKADANITASRLVLNFTTVEKIWLTGIASEDYGGNYDWTVKKHRTVVPDGAAYYYVSVQFWSGATPGNGYVDNVVVPRKVEPALDTDLNLNVNITAQTISSLKIDISAQTIEAVTILAPSAKAVNVAQNIAVSGHTTISEYPPNTETTLFNVTGKGRLKSIGFMIGGGTLLGGCEADRLRIYIDGSLKIDLTITQWMDVLGGYWRYVVGGGQPPAGEYTFPLMTPIGGIIELDWNGQNIVRICGIIYLETEYTSSFSIRIYEGLGASGKFIYAGILYGGYA